MPLNSAGVDVLLNDGNEATIYAAIGDGATSGDQVSAARQLLTLGAPSGGVITVSNVPLAFTGTPNGDATHVLLFTASTAGTFLGSEPLTGDSSFNGDGDYNITSLTITGTGT